MAVTTTEHVYTRAWSTETQLRNHTALTDSVQTHYSAALIVKTLSLEGCVFKPWQT